MASPKNSIQLDAILQPQLGDMDKVTKDLSAALTRAARPLVDSVSNTKVGLNQASLRKVHDQLNSLGREVGVSFDRALTSLFSEGNLNKHTAKGLKNLAKQTDGGADIRSLVNTLGGYNEAASILSRPDARRRLEGINSAFRTMGDVANQVANLPGVDDKTQRMLTKLYKSNSAQGFQRLSTIQQQQVRDAMAVVDLQDRAFTQLRNSLANAGMGSAAADVNRALKDRQHNARRLARITSPEAAQREADGIQRKREAEARKAANKQMTQQRLDTARARSQAAAVERDRVLQRVGGITNLRDPQDIRAVRAGLNRDYNMATQQQAIYAHQGGTKRQMREAATEVDRIKTLRAELDGVVDAQKRQQAANISQQRAEQKQLADRSKWLQTQDAKIATQGQKLDMYNHQQRTRHQQAESKQQEQLDLHRHKLRTDAANRARKQMEELDVLAHKGRTRRADAQRKQQEKLDLFQHQQRTARERDRDSTARRSATQTEAQRILQSRGGVSGLTDPLEIRAVRAGFNRELTAAMQQRSVALAQGDAASAKQAEQTIERMRSQVREVDKVAATQRRLVASQRRALDQEVQLRNPQARNALQARAMLRASGGDINQLDGNQIRTMRPYLQDRFQQRTRYAEGVGARHGTDSPEFARATQSAQNYARALGDLDTRARALRPSISDLGQVIRTFTRYALGYGALYQMLGAVTGLGRGLVDLDAQFHNIQAITMSTSAQMGIIDSAIKQVGLTTRFTLNEVAQGAQILAQAGTAPERIPEQLAATADFAAATNTAMAEAADLITSFENVYTNIGSGKVADLLTKALNLSKMQGSDLRTIVSFTAQTAEGYNISAENLLGAVATLRNVGIRPSTVATGLRQAMLEIFNPDARLLKALEKRYAQMGEETTQAMISAQYNAFTFAENPLLAAIAELRRIGFADEAAPLFGRAIDVRAYNPLKALVANYDQFSGLSTQVGIGQSAAEASEIQLESLRATLQNLGAAVIAFSDSIGGDMVRSLQDAVSGTTELIQRLTELDLKLKSETGEGLGSVLSNSLMGGAAGAMLGGRGFVRRATGAATGAYAAGSLTSNSLDSESSGSDNVIPIIAALLTFAPALLDIVGGMRGRGAELKKLTANSKGGIKGAGAAVGPALSFAGVVYGAYSIVRDLATFRMPKALEGLGKLGGARALAGLAARFIPVIGAVWTAYEIINWMANRSSDVDAEVTRSRAMSQASNTRYRNLSQEYDAQQTDISEWRIDEFGQTETSTTAATIAGLNEQAEGVNLAVQRVLGAAWSDLGEAGDILQKYSSQDSAARKRALKELERITGKAISDADLYDVSTRANELTNSVERFRQDLAHMLERETEKLIEAIDKPNNEEEILSATRMQRVLDEMPELRDFLYQRVELSADVAAEMLREFSNRMADEMEKGTVTATERLDARVDAAVKSLATMATAMGNSKQLQDASQQLLNNITLVESEATNAMQQIAQRVEESIPMLRKRLAEAQEEVRIAAGSADAALRNPHTAGMATVYRGQQADAQGRVTELENALLGAETQAGIARDAERREREQDRVELQNVRGAAAETLTTLTDMFSKGEITDDFLRTLDDNQRALLQRASTGRGRAMMLGSGELEPTQFRGEYRDSELATDLKTMVNAVQQFHTQQDELSKKQALENAKRDSRSDPQTLVQIAALENQRRAADRRNDIDRSKALTEQIYRLQYAEQEKAVARAQIDMAAAEEDDSRDGTSAAEKYYREIAKLESMRGDMVDKIDQYDKKISDLDLKSRTVETTLLRDRLKKEFDAAVDVGDYARAKEASDQYLKVQKSLIELAEEELALKGYSPDQIRMEIESRDELTTSLINQVSAQNELTRTMKSNAEQLIRFAGTGPTTGNWATDAYVEASGVGFTQAQHGEAYARDIEMYQAYIAQRTADTNQRRIDLQESTTLSVRDAQQLIANLDDEYLQDMRRIQVELGKTAQAAKQLDNSFSDELWEGLNPTGLLVALQNSDNTLMRFSDNLKNHVVTGIDSLGSALSEVILLGGDLDDTLKSVIHTMASDMFTSGMKFGVNYLAEEGLKMIPGVEDGSANAGGVTGMLSTMFGIGGGEGDQTVGTANITAGVVHLSGNTPGGEGRSLGLPGLGGFGGGGSGDSPDGPAPEDVVGGGVEKALGGPIERLRTSMSEGWGTLASTFSNGLSSLLGGLGGLFSGLFGGGGGGSQSRGSQWGNFLFNATASYFTGGASSAGTAAGGGGGGAGMKDGGMPSRKIRGRRGTRDNLQAYASVNGRTTPIMVESEEGILSRKAMALIGGEAGLNLLNSGKPPRFSVGGVPQASYNPGQKASTGAESVATATKAAMTSGGGGGAKDGGEVNIANIYSEQGFADFVSSNPGRKVIINMLQKEGVVR